MRDVFVKGSIVLALAAAFGVSAPAVVDAKLTAVQPTVAVVDENHAAIVGANGLLNAFIQNHPNASITEIAFDSEGGQIKYEIEGFDETGKYELVYVYATNNIFEQKDGEYTKALDRKAFNPRVILPPALVVNFAFAQTGGKAVSLNSWTVRNEKSKPIYKVSFGTAGTHEIAVRVDATTGQLLSVKEED